MSMNNQHFLVVTGLGSDKIGVLEAFTKASKQCGSNILESKLTTMGAECVFLAHLTGTWNAIAKLEATIPQLAQQFGYNIQTKRTFARPLENALPYHVQVVAQDRSGILNELSLFFAQQGIRVEKMECETYTAKNHTPLTSIVFLINIPAKSHVATIRERFIAYCEDRNLDAIMEPFKN